MTGAPSPAQLRILMFLAGCGRAGPRSVSRHLWATPSRRERALIMLRRLELDGLVAPIPGFDGWVLTDAGRQAADAGS